MVLLEALVDAISTWKRHMHQRKVPTSKWCCGESTKYSQLHQGTHCDIATACCLSHVLPTRSHQSRLLFLFSRRRTTRTCIGVPHPHLSPHTSQSSEDDDDDDEKISLAPPPPISSPASATLLMSSSPWDYIAKLVCIGDSGCGKSSLTIRLCEGRFSAHHDVTIGVEFGSRVVAVGPPHTQPPALAAATTSSPSSPDAGAADSDGGGVAAAAAAAPDGLPEPRRDTSNTPQKHMKLSLWDTAGQETYKSVTRSYFRGASGALLVFDLSRKQTFQHVTDWLSDLRQIAEPDIVVILVGNKADLTQQENNKREVTRDEAEEWARRNGVFEYVETSAKSGENVERAFMRVAERIYQNIQAGKYDLNDRRSGVKGPSAGGNRQVRLAADASKSIGSGCC